ncbi:DUF2971 domain-containing protein [Luteibacter aegosomatissinici]|uniref:DUF2971 domain-containing protein n=1 Tax=Luteibacter aegosomatissinici TaxID=2911539 RepID=UPI001FF85C91|nr:DUF2971 domain-containing protein [Luteibacter aegosomatissinici]UPG94559.1 DUF2971 domain-containing protein [Luteibacter aegosomatissinici]
MANDQYLYRILSFEHIVDIFESESLYFASPRSWDDPYESYLSADETGAVFAQCWSKRAVSDAMWRIYSNDRRGLRIRTSRSKLKLSLKTAREETGISWLVQDVTYEKSYLVRKRLAEIREEIRLEPSARRAADSLLTKRDAFDHEYEVRAIVRDKANHEEKGFLRVAVRPHELIENIYFDPRVDRFYERVCTHYLRSKLKYKGAISRSSLYKEI